MNRKLIITLITFILIVAAFPMIVFADEGSGGQPGAFLRIPVNARANGMGSAFTAVVHDPTAGWWNPAGLGFVEQIQLAGMYSVMSMDRLHNFAGLAIPFGKGGALGINWLQFGVSDIDGRDITGQPTGKFNDNEMAFGLSYAFKIGPVFSIGVTGKYLNHSLQDYKASGFGADAGVMLNINKMFHAGFTFQNITGSLKWNTDSELKETLPKVYRAGVGFKPAIFPLLITLDAAKIENEDKMKIYAGSEVWLFRNLFALRGGYAVDNFTIGTSIGWQGPRLGFQLDYAFLQDVLEESPTSQISFILRF